MAPQFQFVMRNGPTPGATFSLEGDQIIIGRDSSSGVAINDAEVSRKHARMSFQGGKYVLEDLGSTNGTFVNGQRLAGPVVLKGGDVVSLGEQIVLMFDAMSVDAGATMVSSRQSASRPAAPAGAAGPAAAAAPAYAAPGTPARRNMTPLLIAVGALVVICVCAIAVFYLWNAPSTFWCQTFPFLSGCTH